MELINDVKRVIMAPSDFFAEQAEERDLKTGFIILGLIFVLGLAGNLLLISSGNLIEDALKSAGIQKEMALGFLLLLTPVAFALSLLMLSVWCGIMHFIATMLGGKGTYKGFLACFLFMQVISVIFIPFSILLAYMTLNGIAGGNLLTTLLSISQFVWFAYLLAVAIKKVYTLSTVKAIIVMLTPGVIAVLLFGGLVVLLMPKA